MSAMWVEFVDIEDNQTILLCLALALPRIGEIVVLNGHTTRREVVDVEWTFGRGHTRARVLLSHTYESHRYK